MKEIKEEVYKCSKCGLCQSVCPIYLATKNEIYLPRGRYVILNNFFNNNKSLSKEFIDNLDICLNCNLCKNFCPSFIDSYKIFTILKEKNNFKNGIIPFYLKNKLILYFYKIFKRRKNTQRREKINNPNGEKVVYFEGCYSRYTDKSNTNASLNLIEMNGYKVEKIISKCCGYPYLSEGKIKKFKQNAINIIKNIPTDVKYIICSCDMCYDTLTKCFEYGDDTKLLKNKLITIDELLKIRLGEFFDTELVNCPGKFRSRSLSQSLRETIYYHLPLERTKICYLPQNIKVINKKGRASLMENFFMLKHKKMYNKILNKIFYRKEELENKTIITTCQISKFGLEEGVKKLKYKCKIYSYSEYIYNLLKNNSK